ncbi:MAG: carboxypeptidase regulatory-like domain-containing protein [Fibrobacteria bacterium]|nr:carboxypeptidase regulatory-like domain-containing protein [Fibrobacteria bacterium]
MIKTSRILIIGGIFLSLFIIGCIEQNPVDSSNYQEIAPLAKQSTSDYGFVKEVKRVHEKELLKIPGVLGTGVGKNSEGELIIVVLTENAGVQGIPASKNGVKFGVNVTGKIRALGKPSKESTADPTARFTRPVPIGVSTGHTNITAGTIGCRVMDAMGNIYALSNNHVYADENNANIGDQILQPGPHDGGVAPADAIGTLSDYEPILFGGVSNILDAAISLTNAQNLGIATFEGGYGIPQASDGAVSSADIGIKVLKCGRTTGCTEGQVDLIDASVNVQYDGGVALFTGQVIIKNVRGRQFSDGGDSGSLIVKKDNTAAFALLFAGSSTSTIGNPIHTVLERFGVSIDNGQAPPQSPADPGSIQGLITGPDSTTPLEGAIVTVAGLSDTTEADGLYSIEDVPVGSQQVTAVADGFLTVSRVASVESNQTTIDVNFSLNEYVGSSSALVSDISYSLSGGKNQDKNLATIISVTDEDGHPVLNASVSVRLILDITAWVATASTDTNGTVSFVKDNARRGCYRTEVTAVEKTGLVWEGTYPTNSFCKE